MVTSMLKPLLALTLFAACTSQAPAPIAPTPVAEAAASPAAFELAARRAQMLSWLHDYREAGVFPTDALGRPASVFVDERGVRCPMAELVHKSGRDDLVAAVAREHNAVRLADVHDGPLHDWMLASGLTRDEINLVQGVMELDLGWMEQELRVAGTQILAANAQIRGKLETAEVALRDNTAASLGTTVKRLPPGRDADALARTPVAGSVLSVEARSRATTVAPTHARGRWTPSSPRP